MGLKTWVIHRGEAAKLLNNSCEWIVAGEEMSIFGAPPPSRQGGLLALRPGEEGGAPVSFCLTGVSDQESSGRSTEGPMAGPLFPRNRWTERPMKSQTGMVWEGSVHEIACSRGDPSSSASARHGGIPRSARLARREIINWTSLRPFSEGCVPQRKRRRVYLSRAIVPWVICIYILLNPSRAST